MSSWLVVWLVVFLSTTVALLVMAAFLVRQVILLGRTAGRMQEELEPIAGEVVAASARAADAAASLSGRTSAKGPVRRKARR
jgi:hypothetical protein